MHWLINLLPKLAPTPVHKCHFRRLRAGWARNKCVYKCECGNLYGRGYDGWIIMPKYPRGRNDI